MKQLIISSDGRLLKILNMDELVEYAIETSIAQLRGLTSTDEEKAQYRAMLIDTQKATLTKAVQCDLSFIWASWVQHWTQQRKTVGEERHDFGLRTVELSQKHASSPADNKRTVGDLIHSVINNGTTGDPAATAGGASPEAKIKMEKEIEVQVATQEESYTTLFERDTVRPFVASYQKVTHTELALHVSPVEASTAAASSSSSSSSATPASPVLHTISQTEYKNSRHVFIWSTEPQLSTKDYIQGVYQAYLDSANVRYTRRRRGLGERDTAGTSPRTYQAEH